MKRKHVLIMVFCDIIITFDKIKTNKPGKYRFILNDNLRKLNRKDSSRYLST